MSARSLCDFPRHYTLTHLQKYTLIHTRTNTYIETNNTNNSVLQELQLLLPLGDLWPTHYSTFPIEDSTFTVMYVHLLFIQRYKTPELQKQ